MKDEWREALRGALENCIKVAESFEEERYKEAQPEMWLTPIIKLASAESDKDSVWTVQDPESAFAEFRDVVIAQKILERRPILEEMTKGWTIVDYISVCEYALTYYGIS